jgi:hypothetical protein
MEAPRFVLAALPAIEAAIFRSADSSGVTSLSETLPRCLIDDPYGELHYALVPDESIWYHSVPSLKSHKFNAIDHLF